MSVSTLLLVVAAAVPPALAAAPPAGCVAAPAFHRHAFAFEGRAELVDDVAALQRRHADALDVEAGLERHRARAFAVGADGHRDVLVQDGELAADGSGVGRAEDDVDRE